MSAEIITFRRVRHRFGDGFFGLDGIDLTIHEGQLLLIAGPNGAGKTLLMRHANGLARPTEGEILYRGKPLKRNLSQVRQKVGLVFQHPEEQIIEDSVAREIAFGPENLGLRGSSLAEQVAQTLDRFGLTSLAERHPLTLSGGERRRLALASIMVMQPKLLILDEPFMELDYPGIRDLLKVLLELHAAGQGICVITHDVGKILAHADRLVLMNRGRIVADGEPASLLPLLEVNGVRNPCRAGLPLAEAAWS